MSDFFDDMTYTLKVGPGGIEADIKLGHPACREIYTQSARGSFENTPKLQKMADDLAVHGKTQATFKPGNPYYFDRPGTEGKPVRAKVSCPKLYLM